MNLHYGHVAVFIFVVCPAVLAASIFFSLMINHAGELKAQAMQHKTKIGE